MRFLRQVCLTAVALGLAFAGRASANTVTYVGVVGNPTDGHFYVGPYQLRLDNGVVFQGACFNSGYWAQAPWQAEVVQASDPALQAAGYSQTLMGQVAYLWRQYAPDKSNWAAVSDAIWALSTGYKSGSDVYYRDPNNKYWKGVAGATAYYDAAVANGGSTSLSGLYVVLPTNPLNRQPFITDTPEPASLGLILMGSGLAAVIRRRRRAA